MPAPAVVANHAKHLSQVVASFEVQEVLSHPVRLNDRVAPAAQFEAGRKRAIGCCDGPRVDVIARVQRFLAAHAANHGRIPA